MSKTDRIYIRVAPDLKEQLQQIAAGENRTLSNYIENLIKRDLESKNKKAEG